MSPLLVPATCRLSVYYTSFCPCNMSLQHVAGTCPCNMTPRVCPPLMLFACIWTRVIWLDRGKELSCIVNVEFRGDLKLWEEFTAIFPQWTLAAYRLRSPTLGKDICRESNGTKTQRNRPQSLQKPQ